MEESKKKHPAEACIYVSKRSCEPPVPLFGSRIKHGRPIALTIAHAEVSSNGGGKKDGEFSGFILPTKRIVEVEMSMEQWATLLTSVNGLHTPCTLLAVEDADVEPYVPQPNAMRRELNATVAHLREKGKTGAKHRARVQEILAKKSITRADCRELMTLFNDLDRYNVENFDFQVEQFTELAEIVMASGKTEMSTYAAHLAENGRVLTASAPAAIMGEDPEEDASSPYSYEPPTEPGDYWRVWGDSNPEIVAVELRNGELGTWKDDGEFVPVFYHENIRWSRKITPPARPEPLLPVSLDDKFWAYQRGTPYPPFATEDLMEICQKGSVHFAENCENEEPYVCMTVDSDTGHLMLRVSCDACDCAVGASVRKTGRPLREDLLRTLRELAEIWNWRKPSAVK